MKCTRIVALIFFCVVFSFSHAANGQGRTHAPLITGLAKSILWSGERQEKEINLGNAYKCRVKPLSLDVGLGHPNGTEVNVLFRDFLVNLYVVDSSLGGNFHAFDEDDELNSGYFIQTGIYDFDHIGVPEVVVAVGDGSKHLQITIFKFRPPARQNEAGNLENWKVVGSLAGKSSAYMSGATIHLLLGSGRENAYTWQKGKFVEDHG